MSVVIGLAISSDELRALRWDGREVTWAVRAARVAEPELATQVAELLRGTPRSRWGRPTVAASVGPSASQVRRIAGLPPVADGPALDALVRESAPRFFLRNGVPLQITGALRDDDGSAVAAAIELPTVEAIERGCRMAGYRVRAIFPAAVALAAALPDAELAWRDGETTLELRSRGSAVGTARRRASGAEGTHRAPPMTPVALERLGADGWRFSDALGSALSPLENPLALRATERAHAATSRKRVTVAAGAAAAALLLALLAAPVANRVARARTERQLAAIAARARDAARVEQELRRVSAALSEISSFGASRRSVTKLLSGVEHALPATSALIAFNVDSLGGTLVLFAPNAARAVAALDSVRGIASPRIVGPVSRETMGARELERASVRFTVAKAVGE